MSNPFLARSSRAAFGALLLALAPGCAPTENNTVSQPVSGVTLGTQPSRLGTGSGHTCALLDDGSVRCWGDNTYGQLGDGTLTARSRPVTVSGIEHARQVAVGSGFACVIAEDRTVQCFGGGDFCELGADPTETIPDANSATSFHRVSRAALTVPGLTGATQLSVAGHNACARINDGTVRCWGRSSEFVDPNPASNACALSVAQVPGLSHVAQVAALPRPGGCALHDDGTVSCWSGSFGALPDGTPDTLLRSAPARVAGLTNVVHIAVDSRGSGDNAAVCAVRSDGSVHCFGDNAMGTLGDGTTASRTTPAAVIGLPGPAARVAIGGRRACAILRTGEVYCWGAEHFSDPDQQATLGPDRCEIPVAHPSPDPSAPVNTLPCALAPHEVTGMSAVADLALGDAHGCAISGGDTVQCFGVAAHGSFGDGTTDQRLAGPTSVIW